MDNQRLWVFGYGSLMWHPGFEYDQKIVARLGGYHRSFCMSSIHHRGSVEKPGLVLALDAKDEAFCDGLAFRVRQGDEDRAVEYLRERELISSAYLETSLPLQLLDGREIRALSYVVDVEHVQYLKEVPLETQAQIIASAVGDRGPNTEYLYNTARHLGEIGIKDDDLQWLDTRVREIVLG